MIRALALPCFAATALLLLASCRDEAPEPGNGEAAELLEDQRVRKAYLG